MNGQVGDLLHCYEGDQGKNKLSMLKAKIKFASRNPTSSSQVLKQKPRLESGKVTAQAITTRRRPGQNIRVLIKRQKQASTRVDISPPRLGRSLCLVPTRARWTGHGSPSTRQECRNPPPRAAFLARWVVSYVCPAPFSAAGSREWASLRVLKGGWGKMSRTSSERCVFAQRRCMVCSEKAGDDLDPPVLTASPVADWAPPRG